MKKLAPLAALATLATFALLPVAVHAEAAKIVAGAPIYGQNGQRIANVYRVNADGSVDIILDGHFVNLKGSTLNGESGKIVSSQSMADLYKSL